MLHLALLLLIQAKVFYVISAVSLPRLLYIDRDCCKKHSSECTAIIKKWMTRPAWPVNTPAALPSASQQTPINYMKNSWVVSQAVSCGVNVWPEVSCILVACHCQCASCKMESHFVCLFLATSIVYRWYMPVSWFLNGLLDSQSNWLPHTIPRELIELTIYSIRLEKYSKLNLQLPLWWSSWISNSTSVSKGTFVDQ